MAIYIIPIFVFGLVITGIVFLGIQQASDLAKELAARRSEMEPGAETSEVLSPRRSSSLVNAIVSTKRQ